MPKHLNALLKDASIKIRAALLSNSIPASSSGKVRDSPAVLFSRSHAASEPAWAGAIPLQPALVAIDALVSDPLWAEADAARSASSTFEKERGRPQLASQVAARENGSSASGSRDGQPGSAGAASDGSSRNASNAAHWQASIAQRLNADLTGILTDEMDQDDPIRTSALVDILYHLEKFIPMAAIVTDWWDLLLRPVLKDIRASPVTASRARDLVIRAMVGAPASAYPDELPPVAVWPAVDEPGTAARKAGDAPYTAAAAARPSPSSPSMRSKRSGSTVSSSYIHSESGSLPKERTMRVTKQQDDMFKRFSQRMFDLYTTEVAHAEAARAEEEERKDAEADSKASREDGLQENSSLHIEDEGESAEDQLRTERTAQISATWRSNLEAILLAFGAAEPKRFFHHTAASFSESSARICLLVLLTTYLRMHSMHTYHITSTALPKQLMLSLQLDTSSTVIALGLTALVMLMPHIPDWIANGGAGGLPTFLNIFSRIVDWRNLGKGWEERTGEGHEEERRAHDEEYTEVDRIARRLEIRADLNWQRVGESFLPELVLIRTC